jgi:hypothetical protein
MNQNSFFDLGDAKLMQQNGVISLIEIIPRDNQFILAFQNLNGETIYLKTQRGQIRYFKTLDSAFSVVKNLGLNSTKLRIVEQEI